jgi:hypothetical protein
MRLIDDSSECDFLDNRYEWPIKAAHLYLLLKKKMSGQERITRIHSRNPSAPG